MSDQYLWDKSGTPDAEIEQLERVLGSLRYRPSENNYAPTLEATRAALPLAAQHIAAQHIAAQSIANPRRVIRFRAPAFAIAATLVLAIVAGSLWLKMHTPQLIDAGDTQSAVTTTATDETPEFSHNHTPDNSTASVDVAQANPLEHTRAVALPHKRYSRNVLQRRSTTATTNRVANSIRSGEENESLIAEGERAKTKLVLALHIASEKLHFAQKRIQINKDDVPAS